MSKRRNSLLGSNPYHYPELVCVTVKLEVLM